MKWLLLLSIASTLCGQSRKVCLTIDDLPRGGDDRTARDLTPVREMTLKLTAALRGTGAIGFVNPGRAGALGSSGLQEILKIWRDAGLELGNHSYSHPDFNDTDLGTYTADILKAETALMEASGGRRPAYFRHPFLHAGDTPEKRMGLEDFLRANHYTIAPVTVDDSDYVFAFVYAETMRTDPALAARVRKAYIEYLDGIFDFFEKRSVTVVGREIAQIVLLHANRLNADSMPDLLAMLRNRGYSFVTLAKAMEDPAYRMRDHYVEKNGISWIHRWGATKGMKIEFEPAEPAWVMEEYRRGQAVNR